MTMPIVRHLPILRCVCVAVFLAGLAPLSALAAVPVNLAHVKGGTEEGSGYLVRKGPDCLLVTARHVVVNVKLGDKAPLSDGIQVFDEQNFAATGTMTFSSAKDDLAILKLDVPPKYACAATWQDGGAVKDTLKAAVMDTSTVFRILTLREGGDINATDAKLLGTDPPANFDISATTTQGQSGSPVISGSGTLMGIVLSTSPSKDNTGGATKVLRQDYINSIAGDFLKTTGVKILLMPIRDENGRPIPTAVAAARQYFETLPNLVPREPLPQDYGPDGQLTTTGDAQYIFEGNYLTGNINIKKSVMGMILGAGKALGGVSNLANEASNVAEGAGLTGQTKIITLRIEFVLTNISTRETYTSLYEDKEQFPGDQDNDLIVDKSVEDAVVHALPVVLVKAGLIEAPPPAAVPAPAASKPGEFKSALPPATTTATPTPTPSQ